MLDSLIPPSHGFTKIIDMRFILKPQMSIECQSTGCAFMFLIIRILCNPSTIYRMKKQVCLVLLSIASVAPFLATGCSTAHSTTKQGRKGGYVQIEPRRYNPETRGFDRPWPFGPESDAQ
jgi:hypothetical protein